MSTTVGVKDATGSFLDVFQLDELAIAIARAAGALSTSGELFKTMDQGARRQAKSEMFNTGSNNFVNVWGPEHIENQSTL